MLLADILIRKTRIALKWIVRTSGKKGVSIKTLHKAIKEICGFLPDYENLLSGFSVSKDGKRVRSRRHGPKF